VTETPDRAISIKESPMGALFWFLRSSWSYLGCDRGAGRWRARRTYLAGLVPAAVKFMRLTRADERASR